MSCNSFNTINVSLSLQSEEKLLLIYITFFEIFLLVGKPKIIKNFNETWRCIVN